MMNCMLNVNTVLLGLQNYMVMMEDKNNMIIDFFKFIHNTVNTDTVFFF